MNQVTIKRRVVALLGCGAITLACSAQGEQTPAVSGGTGASGSGVAGATPAAGNGGRAGSTAGNAGSVAGAIASPVAGRGAAGSTQPPAMPAAGSGGSATGSSGANGTASAGSGGASGTGAAGSSGAAGSTPQVPAEHFSFFVTSWAAIQRVSKSSDGFGGDLRYGEADGLAGADKICTEIAETSMPGSGAKVWRAFLSVTKGPTGQPIHAIDRVGEGPWYDRRGRLLAMNKTELVKQRPGGADPTIINDLPNEDGIPNHAPDGMQVDNHDILTGTNDKGQLYNPDWAFTCHDWTSKEGRDGTPRVGHSWPRMGGGRPPRGGAAGSGGGAAGSGSNFVPPPRGGNGAPNGGDFDTANWMSALIEAGCAAGASLVEMGPPNPDIPTVGSGGGYGGIYCFALKP